MIVIDRFEGDYAVLETDDGMMNIHRGHLPSSAREGDALSYSNGGFSVLPEETLTAAVSSWPIPLVLQKM